MNAEAASRTGRRPLLFHPQLNKQVNGDVAQLDEQRIPNPPVAGSSPVSPAHGPPRSHRAWTWHDLRTAQWNGMRSPAGTPAGHHGALAQLVARFRGTEEVGGSNPPGSTHVQLSPAFSFPEQVRKPNANSCLRSSDLVQSAGVKIQRSPVRIGPQARCRRNARSAFSCRRQLQGRVELMAKLASLSRRRTSVRARPCLQRSRIRLRQLQGDSRLTRGPRKRCQGGRPARRGFDSRPTPTL